MIRRSWFLAARYGLAWLDPLVLTRRERLVAATTVAAGIVFLGLFLDVPSVKRLKAMEVERTALEAEIAILQREVVSLAPAQLSEVLGEESQGLADPRFSELMRYLTAMAALSDIDVMAIRPVPGTDTRLMVELNADLRTLGRYFRELEQSHWGLTIGDVHLMRNPERIPSISARFAIASSMVTSGLPVAQSDQNQ